MEKKQIVKIGLYTLGGIATLIGGIVVVNKIKKANFSAQGKKDGSEKKSEDVVGKTVSAGASGYVNVRSSPEIPLAVYNCAWYDLVCQAGQAGAYAIESVSGTDVTKINVIATLSKNPIGVIQKVVAGKDGWNWYKIEFDKEVMSVSTDNWIGIGTSTKKATGYVREDAVTVNY